VATNTQERFLAKSLANLPDEFLICRDPSIGHDWKETEGLHVAPQTTVGRAVTCIRRSAECARCTTTKIERFVLMKSQGVERLEKTGTDVRYPEGYQLPGVPRGVKPAGIVRAEQYRRVLGKAVARQKVAAAR
jgi:hypothetical protein